MAHWDPAKGTLVSDGDYGPAGTIIKPGTPTSDSPTSPTVTSAPDMSSLLLIGAVAVVIFFLMKR